MNGLYQRAAARSVALIGNPNTGKTTLFNALTGLSQRVGNYPGVTVERKTGKLELAPGRTVELVDLPGAYSLAASSPDQMIAADVLLRQQPGTSPIDVVVAIVDASNLRRNLYLVSQLLEASRPLVIALNMTDVAATRSIRIDAIRLSSRLGVPVIPISAQRRHGIDDLREAITNYDTIVLMEVNRTLLDALANLESLGLAGKAIYVRRATTPREQVVQDIHQLSAEDLDYFSLLIINRGDMGTRRAR